MAIDTSGWNRSPAAASKAPLGVGAGASLSSNTGQGWQIDLAEQQREEALARAASAASQKVAARQPASPTVALKVPDNNSTIMRSIDAVGGAEQFSFRVNRLATFWQNQFGTPIAPTLALDMARIPVAPKVIEAGILAARQGSGVYRGLTNPLSTGLVNKSALMGQVYLGENRKTPAQMAMEKQIAGDTTRNVAAEAGLPESGLLMDVLWWSGRSEGEIQKNLMAPYQIARTSAPVPTMDAIEWTMDLDTRTLLAATIAEQAPGAARLAMTMANAVSALRDVNAPESGINPSIFKALDYISKGERVAQTFFYETGKHVLRPALGMSVGVELADYGIGENATPEEIAARLAELGITEDMTTVEQQMKQAGLTGGGIGFGVAGEHAVASGMSGETAFQHVAMNAFSYDLAKNMPLANFALDFAASALIEFPAFGLVKAGVTATKVPEVVNWAMRKSPWVDDITTAVAKEFNPGKVAAMTGLKHYPSLAQDLASASTNEQVRDILVKAVAKTTGVLDPSDALLWRQAKIAARAYGDRLPPVMQTAYKMSPETDAFRIRETEIYDSALQLCDSFNLKSEDVWHFVGRAMSATSDPGRNKVLNEIWQFAEANYPKQMARATAREAYHVPKKKKVKDPASMTEGEQVAGGKIYATDPTPGSAPREMSHTTPPAAQQHTMNVVQTRQDYLDAAEELYAVDRASAEALKALPLDEAEHAAGLKQIADTRAAAVEKLHSAISDHLTALEIPKESVANLATDYAKQAQKALDPDVWAFIKDRGGFKWGKTWDDDYLREGGLEASAAQRIKESRKLIHEQGMDPEPWPD
jgi:hypothetical protein